MSDRQLLVPIKIDALVIDDGVFNLRDNTQQSSAHWHQRSPDYGNTFTSLAPPGPLPFLGAYTDRTGLHLGNDLVTKENRGVYIHWVLPPGLRHAHQYAKDNALKFPPLPDRWLVCRLLHRGGSTSNTQIKAWVVDSSIIGEQSASPKVSGLGVPHKDGYLEGKEVGRVMEIYPNNQFVELPGPRTKVTATGNAYTGSPIFTAHVAENRNMFSLFDDLSDLREVQSGGSVPEDVILSYLVLGGYRDQKDEILASMPAAIVEPPTDKNKMTAAILDALGWQIGTERMEATDLPADLSQWRSLFHGLIAYINYWNPGRYKGNVLGHPGAPGAHSGLISEGDALKVGIGHNAADALIALVAQGVEASGEGETSDESEARALWKALEAVVYNRTQSLLSSWQEVMREFEVHQSWYEPVPAGLRWSIVAQDKPSGSQAFPSVNTGKSAAHEIPKPNEEQQEALRQLNVTQRLLNRLAREVAALQQELYGRWWALARAVFNARDKAKSSLQDDCRSLADQIDEKRKRFNTERALLAGQLRALRTSLVETGLLLQSVAAPRFYRPSDPVVIVHNINPQHRGRQRKHDFPNPLICRPAGHYVTGAEINIQGRSRRIESHGVAHLLSGYLSAPFPETAATIQALLTEAIVVEQALFSLADGSGKPKFTTDREWDEWLDQLHLAEQWDGRPETRPLIWLQLEPQSADSGLLSRMARYWEKQPWRPLYMDWRLSYYPYAVPGETAVSPNAGWRREAYDYRPPADAPELPRPGSKNEDVFAVQGRTLVNPIATRYFTDPIDKLKALLAGNTSDDQQDELNPQVAAVLSGLSGSWSDPLDELVNGGLMGQVLAGFHQAFLQRDTLRPRAQPNPELPWLWPDPEVEVEFTDDVMISRAGDVPLPGAEKYLDPLRMLPDNEPFTLPNLAPPGNATPDGRIPIPFQLARAGAFKLEALWIVDDFGQWVDVLDNLPVAHTVISPHARWPGDREAVALPPRIVQPARLDFRFYEADFKHESDGHPKTNPICGWVYHNYLDEALTLCDRDGRLLGELVLVEQGTDQLTAVWNCLAAGVPATAGVEMLSSVDSTLFGFARALTEDTGEPQLRLHALLALIDRALATIRPQGDNRFYLVGRPLALVNAVAGISLFGAPWTPTEPLSTGMHKKDTLTNLALPLLLGHDRLHHDGLIGYFERGGQEEFTRIVPVAMPDNPQLRETAQSSFLADPELDAVMLGFGAPRALTLLMDPQAAVHANIGILPTKSLRLPAAYVQQALEQLEISFRVAPVLFSMPTLGKPDQASAGEPPVSMPVPAGVRGVWFYHGSNTENGEVPVVSPTSHIDPDPGLPLAAEGRLVLRSDKGVKKYE